MEKTEIAAGLFRNNYNCAQSVFGAFAEDYGLPRDQALKLAGGLGGGVRCGEVCGAATGAALVIGLKNGQESSSDLQGKEFCNNETAEFMKRFREIKGSVTCRDILGMDTSIPENRLKAKELNLFGTVCVDMVTQAVEILEDMGY